MMKLVARLEKHADLFEGDEGALMREAASAIEEMCEHLDECWTKYEAAVAAEREACAQIAHDAMIDFLSPEYATSQPISSFGERFACNRIMKAIRARQPSPPQSEDE